MTTEMRRAAIPSANNPRLLIRTCGWLARGVRSTRALQEVLGVELRTVQYYLQAATWMGFIEDSPDHLLTPMGLELVFADDPSAVYATAVWAQPFVRDLLTGRGHTLPPVEDVVVAIARAEPDLAPATVRRRASAVRSLLAPALERRRRPRPVDLQLALPLASQPDTVPHHLTPGPAKDADPDVLRWVYESLLDHGELTLGQLRGLLDVAGVSDLPIGGYIDLLLVRGDARRMGERLVITPGAVARRQAASSTTGVILSHARYRQWLDDVRQAALGDREAEIRMHQVERTFRAWDQRLLGGPAEASTLDERLGRVLLDRSLDAFPRTGDPGPLVEPVERSFLDCWQEAGLVIALPPTLSILQAGLPAINRQLQQARQGTADVGEPTIASRPSLVHGGLLHPGEPRPRSVPDVVSLRQRALMNAPYVALVTALLLLHRTSPDSLCVVRRRNGWRVLRRGRVLGPVLELLDRFAASRGWIPSRRIAGGLGLGPFLAGLETAGIAHVLGGDVAVLAERLFHRLRTDPEEMEVHALLLPLADVLEGWLQEARPLDEARP